ncbi:MAG: ATP-binding protein [Actinomycetes bacterium]
MGEHAATTVLHIDDDEALEAPEGALVSIGRQVARAHGWRGVAVDLDDGSPPRVVSGHLDAGRLVRVELPPECLPARALVFAGPPEDEVGAAAIERAAPAIARTAARLQRRDEDGHLAALSESFLVVLDAGGTIRSANRSFCQLVGRTREALVGTEVWPLVHPADRDEVAATLRSLLEDDQRGGTRRSTFRTLEASGGQRRLAWRLSGRPLEGRVHAVAQDIEVSLRAADFDRGHRGILRAIAEGQRLEDVVADLADLLEQRLLDVRVTVLLADEEGVLHVVHGEVGREVVTAAGGLPIGLVSSPCTLAARDDELVVASDLARDARFADLRDVLLELGIVACWSMPVSDRSGTPLGVIAAYPAHPRPPRPAEVEALETARELARLAVATGQEREQLRLSEERFRLVSTAATDVIYDHDLEHDLVRWGGDPEECFGWSDRPEETPVAWWDERVHPDDVARVREARRRLDIGERRWSYRVRRVDGRWAHVEDRAHVTVGPHGHLHRVGGITDVTALREAEEARLRVQRLDSLGALAGGIAHDLNNVFTPIIMAADLLGHAVAAEDRPNVEMIARAARRGADMVRQVLAFARGIAPDGPAEVPVAEAVEQIAATLLDAMPRSVHLRVDVPADLPRVAIDRTKLQQVVVNLVLNARDAVGEGGRIELRGWSRRRSDGTDAVFLAVRDTGCGIRPADLPRVFDEFFTTKEESQGTGLGLPISERLVAAVGGTITVASEVGVGTTFVVSLPASATAQVQEAGREREALMEGRDRHVLVVDDEQAILTLVEQTLVAHGFRVTGASNGADGLSRFAREADDLDLVLLDLDLPVLDGRTALVAMRRLSPHVPVIVMTTPRDHEDLDGVPVLTKPFDAATLARAIDAAMGTTTEGVLHPPGRNGSGDGAPG